MFATSKCWYMVSAIGQGVLFSLALLGAVRITCLMLGVSLSERVAGNIFQASSLITGALAALLYSRYRRHGGMTAARSATPDRK